jgi:hypothetical protein
MPELHKKEVPAMSPVGTERPIRDVRSPAAIG